MTQSISKTGTGNREWMVLMSGPILITLFLFFIDEGYYNFNWMTGIGNWIAFTVYAGSMFLGNLLFSKVLLRKYRWRGKTALSMIGGSVLGFLFVIYVVFTS